MTRFAVAFALLAVSACATMSRQDGWTTLLDGSTPSTLDHWSRVGDANWRAVDGAVVADKGTMNSYLVSPNVYKDFQIRAEFWADHNTNSGIFLRCQDPKKIGANTCYEVNVYDQRPDPSYGTGAIVDVAKVSPMPKAGGKWNTYVITAKGTNLVVELNGVKTVDVNDGKLASGPVALQWGLLPKNAPGGPIKFRKVQIKPL